MKEKRGKDAISKNERQGANTIFKIEKIGVILIVVTLYLLATGVKVKKQSLKLMI